MKISKSLKFFLTPLLVIGNLFLFSEGVYSQDGQEFAVIVNMSNPVDALSFDDIVKIFKTAKKTWDTKDKIYILLKKVDTKEGKAILSLVYGFNSESEMKKFWLEKIYSGEMDVFPQILSSDEAIKKIVKNYPNAIGIILSSNVDDTVKVIKIDGSSPEDEGYRLKF